MTASEALYAAPRSVAPPLTVAEVYRAHADFVWRVVQRFGVPTAEADDVVHEVFLIVQRRLPEFDGRGAVTSWLYAIGRGVAANYRRGQVRAARRRTVAPSPSPLRSPEDDAAEREAVSAVETFLKSELDLETREVFQLADIEGMTGPEVASALDIDLARVHARLKTARRRFNAFVAQLNAERTP
jgi:RNA polymerase sigma-70 factor (ECF subfamily)